MATEEWLIEYVAEQMADAGRITWKRMFGAACLYCNKKPVAFLSGDRLLVKPTEAGRQYIGTPDETELFPGSKLWFDTGTQFEDKEWIAGLIRATADSLKAPKPKRKKIIYPAEDGPLPDEQARAERIPDRPVPDCKQPDRLTPL
ncbi:MAG: competence protein TfoX [Treponema sp.]|jgi:hypothetical protein|nr:MAG: hypothetical protein BWY39_00225 [Spirochaetes bacterium ADurb.Bin269]TAH54696.1 MAG: competence protein TfoX [Treponema sp.]HPX48778.1 TfoX/Sxy family protein [Treponemataceae bacterium]HQL33669.1 TfoX/Sxy family protein [Treponemataceae bacterium]